MSNEREYNPELGHTPIDEATTELLRYCRLRFGKDATLIQACEVLEEICAGLGLLIEETSESESLSRFL